MPPILGCIADDFTGATDLANHLGRAGMRVVQTIGVPGGPSPAPDGATPSEVPSLAEVDAVVVAAAEVVVVPWETSSASPMTVLVLLKSWSETPAPSSDPSSPP